MALDPTAIGVIGTTISAFFVALFGWLGVRDRRTRDIAEKADLSLESLRDDLDEQRHRLDIAMRHIYELRQFMSAGGLEPPGLPMELTPRRHEGPGNG